MKNPRRSMPRAGVSLLELIVALTVLGVIAGVVGLAAPPRRTVTDVANLDAIKAVAAARRHAVDSGVPVRVVIPRAGSESDSVLALPNGSVLGAERYGFDQLSGHRLDQRSSAVP